MSSPANSAATDMPSMHHPTQNSNQNVTKPPINEGGKGGGCNPPEREEERGEGREEGGSVQYHTQQCAKARLMES